MLGDSQEHLELPLLVAEAAEKPSAIIIMEGEDARRLGETLKSPITSSRALKEIMYQLTGTLPLQLVKGAVPFSYSAILSRLNNNTRAGATLINTLEDFTSMIFNSPLFYVQTFLSKLNTPENKQYFGQAAQLSILFSLIVAAPQFGILSGSESMMKTSGQKEIVSEIVGDFFDVYRYSVFMLSVQSVCDQLAIASNRLYLPLGVQSAGFVASTLFAYAFANGQWNAPDLGLMGVAWASLLRVSINVALYCGSFATINHMSKEFNALNLFRKNFKGIGGRFKNLLLNGLPLLIVFGSELGATYTTNILVGRLGTTPLQAQLIIAQYQDLMFVPTSAIGSAMQKLIAGSMKEYGNTSKIYGNIGVALSGVIPLAYLLFSLGGPKLLMAPFMNVNNPSNTAVVEKLESDHLMTISAINTLLTALRFGATQALISADNVGIPLVVGMLASWLGVLAGWALGFEAGFGVEGMNLGSTIGLTISTMIVMNLWAKLDLTPKATPQLEQQNSEDLQNDPHTLLQQRGSFAFLAAAESKEEVAVSAQDPSSSFNFLNNPVASTNTQPSATIGSLNNE
jgi:MATE family multidrug resistance protein